MLFFLYWFISVIVDDCTLYKFVLKKKKKKNSNGTFKTYRFTTGSYSFNLRLLKLSKQMPQRKGGGKRDSLSRGPDQWGMGKERKKATYKYF